MRAPARFSEIYSESPVLITAILVVAALLGVYWGYRFVAPLLLG